MTVDPAGRRRALAVLSVALMLSMTTWFSASAVLPQLRAEWDLSRTAGSFLTIAVQLGFVGGAVLSAALNLPDLVAPRRLMLLGSVVAATANLGLLVADGPASALPLRALTGAALAAVYPPAMKEVATWFRRGRGVALGVMVGALTVGSAAPHLVNALGGVDWRVVVATTSALTVAGGAIAVVAGRDGPYPFPRATFDPRQARAALAHRGVRLATVGYLGHMWELYAMWTWFGVFFLDVLGRHGVGDRDSVAAYVTFVVIASGALGCWAGGVLGDRWGRTRTTGTAMAMSGACAFAVGLLRDAPLALLVAVCVVWGVTVIADSAQFSTMVTELADQRYVGTALTLQLAAGFTLTVLTIFLIPVVTDAWTWRWAFALLVPGPLLGAVAMARLLRSPYAAALSNGRG